MIDIQKIAREAGYGDAMSSLHLPALERFATLIREALVAELVAGSGEPDGLWAYDETVMAWREYNREGFDSCTGTKLEAYTKEQLAGAVLRERERCAQIAEDFPHDQLGCLDEVAEAIRSGE